ncbi:hypothetical protein GQ54DRAFT_272606 [Martensiomyces pterosporus]|nr:hypothetical protein GQ54DRAFT_272606 [Martensiomyces pterosporus]
MANRSSQESKKEALKRKLQSTKRTDATARSSGSKTKRGAGGSLGSRKTDEKTKRQRAKALQQAFAVPDILHISQASVKHNAGRREVRSSLDRSLLENEDLSESLRGIGQAPILTLAQLEQKAKEEREKMAAVYERHQAAVENAMDELAQLMSA